MNQWHRIHSFLDGWGMQEQIPDNEIVLEDHPEDSIPWRVVRSKQEEKCVWLRDTDRWLGIIDIFTMTSEELYDIYDRLIPYQKAEAERIRNLPKPEFKKITIPKIKLPKLF